MPSVKDIASSSSEAEPAFQQTEPEPEPELVCESMKELQAKLDDIRARGRERTAKCRANQKAKEKANQKAKEKATENSKTRKKKKQSEAPGTSKGTAHKRLVHNCV